LPLETAQFYAAQMVSILEYLHSHNVSHRDLKPENLMLDEKMHLKLIDFATAKIKDKQFNRSTMKFDDVVNGENSTTSGSLSFKKKNTFVGTAEYLSPEVLNDEEVGHETDLWALGCVVYQMFTGVSPFKDKTEYLVFKKILDQKVNFPNNIPITAVSLIKDLLNPDPKKRLGGGIKGSSNDYAHLKSHEFFKGIDFNNLQAMSLPMKNYLKLSPNFQDCCLKEGGCKDEELKVIKEGVLKKKSPWFHYNTRKLVLYNKPKLEYIDFYKNMVKGVICLSRDCNSVLIDNNNFELRTPNRTFYFKTEKNEAIEWNMFINNAINRLT